MSAEPAWPCEADLRLLARIGFIACDSGQASAARAIFEALRLHRPGQTLPWIGLACAALAHDHPEQAVALLRDEALPRHADDGELRAFLGLALQCAGLREQARGVLETLLRQAAPGADEPHLRMARRLLTSGHGASEPARAASYS